MRHERIRQWLGSLLMPSWVVLAWLQQHSVMWQLGSRLGAAQVTAAQIMTFGERVSRWELCFPTADEAFVVAGQPRKGL